MKKIFGLSFVLTVLALTAYHRVRQPPAAIQAEPVRVPGARRHSSRNDDGITCGTFLDSILEGDLRYLSALAINLPENRCTKGPISSVFGRHFYPKLPPLDPWMTEYIVDCSPSLQRVRIVSFGSDGIENTADDVYGEPVRWTPQSEAEFVRIVSEALAKENSPAPSASE